LYIRWSLCVMFMRFFDCHNVPFCTNVLISITFITHHRIAIAMEFLLSVLRSILTSPLLLIASIFGALFAYVSIAVLHSRH
jgi:hypothetical protein